MPPLVGVNQWADETRRNTYPFTDIATLRDSTGLLKLQEAWVIDAKIWAAVTETSRVYLSSVTRAQGSLTLQISDLNGVLGTATTTLLNKTRLAFVDTTGFQIGFMAFAPGALQSMNDVPTGTYKFAVEATEFVAAALALQVLGGLQGVQDVKGASITGTLRLVGGDGISLHVIHNSPADPTLGTLRIDVIGDPYFRRDTCVDPDFLGRVINPVRFVTWRDTVALTSGVTQPKANNISTAMQTSKPDPRTRGFVSPGPTGELLGMLGNP
jgi:hypothetical protein